VTILYHSIFHTGATLLLSSIQEPLFDEVVVPEIGSILLPIILDECTCLLSSSRKILLNLLARNFLDTVIHHLLGQT